MKKVDFNSARQIMAARETVMLRLAHLITDRDFYWEEIKRLWSTPNDYFSPDGEHIVLVKNAGPAGELEQQYYRPKLNAIEEEIYKKVLPLAVELGIGDREIVENCLKYYEHAMKAEKDKAP